MSSLKSNNVWDKISPKTTITQKLYLVLVVILLLHSLDVVLTYFGIILGYAREGNDIVVLLFERIGIVLALFLIWFLGLIVATGLALLGRWLEDTQYYFPAPTFFLLTFLVFIVAIKTVTVVLNLNMLLNYY